MISVRLMSSSTCKCRASERGFSHEIDTPTTHTHTLSRLPLFPKRKTTNDYGVKLCEQRDERKPTDQPIDDTKEFFLHPKWQNKERGRYLRAFFFFTCPVVLIVFFTR